MSSMVRSGDDVRRSAPEASGHSDGERSETARSAGASGARTPDPKVNAKAKRRRFTAAEKLRVLQAADACTAPGELGALLRREGIYSSHLAAWRKLRATLGTAGLVAKRRGPAPKRSAEEKRIAELEREIARLQARLETAQTIIAVQKKVAALLGNTIPDLSSDGSE